MDTTVKAVQITWDGLCEGNFDYLGIETSKDPRWFFTPSLGVSQFYGRPRYPDNRGGEHLPGRTIVAVGDYIVTVTNGKGRSSHFIVSQSAFKQHYHPTRKPGYYRIDRYSTPKKFLAACKLQFQSDALRT